LTYFAAIATSFPPLLQLESNFIKYQVGYAMGESDPKWFCCS